MLESNKNLIAVSSFDACDCMHLGHYIDAYKK